MNKLVFPENVGILPKSKRPLMLSHVLALVYCFGGLSGVLYLISKFIVTPLFDQLTFERRLLAEETRERLTQLNIAIGRAVTKIPQTKVGRSDYVEQIVQTDNWNDFSTDLPRAPVASSDKVIVETADKYIESLRELQQLTKSIDPNNERLSANTGVANHANELAKYARSIQYESVPSSMLSLGLSKSKEGNGISASLTEAVIDCKQEIRALKSSILSG